MKKYNYITQEQLINCLTAFYKANGEQDFHHFFINTWVPENIPEVLVESTALTPVQNAFVGDVLTIFNNI